MNVVVTGPFGLGSLADEVMLAGLLRHLRAGKHEITVLSADPARTEAHHAVQAVSLPAPGALLAAKDACRAVQQAHLFVLLSAGVLSAQGEAPARLWLAQLEYAKRLGPVTALVGAGAFALDDPKECARVRHFLRQSADSISVRDDVSKAALLVYGLPANRVSMNGDPALALGATIGLPGGRVPLVACPPVDSTSVALAGKPPVAHSADKAAVPQPQPVPHAGRVGLVVSASVPSRGTFGFEPLAASAPWREALCALARQLSAEQGAELTLFCDDTEPGLALARAAAEAAGQGRGRCVEMNGAVAELRAEMACCEVALSCSLHGILLAAGCGVPVAGLEAEPGAAELLAKLGLGALTVPGRDSFEVGGAVSAVIRARAEAEALRPLLRVKVQALARKEAQNGRMLERLVPRRARFTADRH